MATKAQNSELFEDDEAEFDYLCCSLQRNLHKPKSRNCQIFDINSSTTSEDWFLTTASCKSASSSMSDSTGYGSFRDGTLTPEKRPSPFIFDDNFDQDSLAYYSGSSSSASSTISSAKNYDLHISESTIDDLYRNTEYYDLDTVNFDAETSVEDDIQPEINLDLSNESLDEVLPSQDLAKRDITDMANCVFSMISELKSLGKPEKLHSVPSKGTLQSIPESEICHKDEEERHPKNEHIYEEILEDSQEINLKGIAPPPLPKRNFHSSMITVSSCPNCNWKFAPEKTLRRSLPPSRRLQCKNTQETLCVELPKNLSKKKRPSLHSLFASSVNSLERTSICTTSRDRCNSLSAGFSHLSVTEKNSSLDKNLSQSLSSSVHLQSNHNRGGYTV